MSEIALPQGYSVRPLDANEVTLWLSSVEEALEENGAGGIHWAPFSKRDLPGRRTPERVERASAALSRALSEAAWRRAWVIVENATAAIVGQGSLEGGLVPAALHRCTLGIAIRRAYHRRGMGRALLATLIAWAREQPSLCWMDLGVFGDNIPAQRLYASFGFREIGRREDAFRLDGRPTDDIHMSLRLRMNV